MNKVVRINYEGIFRYPFEQRCFHSSPILERRRRTNWESRSNNYYNRRSRKLNGKEELLRNVGAFAEELFQRWRDDYEEYHPSSRTHPWFRQEFFSDRNGGRPRSRGSKPGSGRRFDFCEDDVFEADDIFRAAFGGNKHFYWSFTSEEPEREYTSSYNTRRRRNWRHQFADEYDSEETNCSASDLASYRLTLGLKASGPLNLTDVKTAYRACALKWHPDRHQGSSKAVAEEKFKICSAAYQSLCDQLIVD
ncbi:hypothetical protein Leryth_016229 [Lithospermum erythrorhizon]|nr:hypothetical protein Leryth_016229 [Lithospermum erythrorhizon]